MKLYLENGNYIDTSKPLDISIPLINSEDNPRAWYVDPPRFETVRTENYIGSIEEGGSVNFRDIYFNPHGHTTHTECLGHITKEVHSVNNTLKNYFFKAFVLTIEPKSRINSDGETDSVIEPDQLNIPECEALIIRTIPNSKKKRTMNYSSQNPTYMDVKCVEVLNRKGVKHLLVDIPSVDRENDNGELIFHHTFWGVPSNLDFERTITELIYVKDEIEDGEYLLELQVAAFENDASPSRPLLYQIKKS